MDVNKRLAKLKKAVENSNTDIRRSSNQRIFENILRYLKESNTENEFHARLIKDYGAFCAWFIDGKDEPFIPAPWQLAATNLFVKYNRMFMLNCRRAGKTTWASSIILWDMCRREKANHLIFAPTKQQLIIMSEVKKIVDLHPFFVENFVLAGRNRELKIEFQANGSSVEAFNIGIQGSDKKGDYLRGMGGNVVWIDEIGLVDEGVRKEVINPIIRDAYGEGGKKMVMFGTPKLAYNPNLEREWEKYKESPYWGTMQVTCWQAMKEGIRTAEMMREVFDEELYIQCKHVTTHGVCPEYAPEMIEGVPEGWKCDQNYICLSNDRFMMEDLASFPSNSDRFFAKEWLEDARQKYGFYDLTKINPETSHYVMAVDLGLLQDPSEVVVAEVMTDKVDKSKKLRYVYWKSINPWEEGESRDAASERHVREIKRIFHFFNPKTIYVDVTRGIDYMDKLLSGDNYIPRARFYSTENQAKKKDVGVWWDGHFKSKMYVNHKDQLQRRNIEIPDDPIFWEKFFYDHYEVKAEPAHGGTYLQFGKKSRHLLDACAMLSLELENSGTKKKPVYFTFVQE